MKYFIFTFGLFIFGQTTFAQLPSDGLTYRYLLKCKENMKGEVKKITETKWFHDGYREKNKYFFDENHKLVRYVNDNRKELNFAYDIKGNLSTQVVKEYGKTIDSLVGVYENGDDLKYMLIYRGPYQHLFSIQQVLYNDENQPQKIKIDELRYAPEKTHLVHHTTWEELHWKNDMEFSVDFVDIKKKTMYISKSITVSALDENSGCLLNDPTSGKRVITNLDGETTVEVYTVSDNSDASKIMVEYDYDTYGNWVEKRHYEINDGNNSRKKKQLANIKRKIEYENDSK